MKLRMLLIAAVLVVFAQGVGFAKGIAEERDALSSLQQQAEKILEQSDALSEETKYNEAITLLLENKDLFVQTGDTYYASSLNKLGNLYIAMGDYTKAETYYLEAKIIREQVLGKNHPDYALSLNNMGNLYSDMGDYARAEPYYLEAKTVFEQVLGKNHSYYAGSLNNLGILYSDMGDYARAEPYFMEAKIIREQVLGKNHPGYAASLNNLGVLYKAMGDYAKAETYYLEAKTIREQVLGKNHPDYAISLNNLGVLYKAMGDYTKAEAYYLEAKTIREQVLGKNHPGYAISLNNLGVLYSEIKDYVKAEPYYLEAKTIREQILGKNHPYYAISLNNLGTLYSAMADYAKAEAYYLEAKTILEQALGKSHPYYGSSLDNLGVLYSEIEGYAKAEPYYLEAKTVREQALGKNHPDYAISLNNLGVLYWNMDDYIKAETYNKELCELRINTINQNFSFMSEQQRNLYLDMVSRDFEASYSLSRLYPIETVNGLNYTNTLFTKGLLLRTTNTVRDAIYSSGDTALIGQFEQLGRLRQQISTLQQQEDTQNEVANKTYLQSLETQADALDKELTRASSAFRDLKADMSMQWHNVRDSLQQCEAAIEFVSFRIYDKKWTDKTQYAALIIKPNSKAPEWVPLCEENALTELFAKLDDKKPQEQVQILYDENGPALYDAIWRPLEKVLEGVTTVYYSPSGLLQKVAFNAIPVNQNSRLADKYNLNMVSSTREVVYIKNRAAGKPSSAVVYGGLDYTVDADTMRTEALAYNIPGTRSGSERDGLSVVNTADYQKKTSGETTWGYLQFTDTESKSIYQLLTGNKIPADLYNGVKGNKESFISLNGKKTVVIHLATHGFFNQDIKKNYEEQARLQQMGGKQKAFENPLRRSGLILAGANTWAKNPVAGTENGILLADEVAGMNLLGADLIVLSACETALGEVNNSEGVFGLQRAFKLAGAQTLIMSLWKVDDEATSILISEFYRNWLSGKSKQEAFKEAQKKVRSDSRYASPFYWAAFVMMD